MIDWQLAHQGGWDEILWFVVPAGLAVLALRWAERRARRRAEHEQELTPPGSDDPDNADSDRDGRRRSGSD